MKGEGDNQCYEHQSWQNTFACNAQMMILFISYMIYIAENLILAFSSKTFSP
jgi:hypothetical protein